MDEKTVVIREGKVARNTNITGIPQTPQPNDRLIIYIDANPNRTCIYPESGPIEEPILGDKTHNEAEWLALQRALDYIKTYESIEILSDSELVVKQFNDEYSVNVQELQIIKRRCKQIIALRGLDVTVRWIPREVNKAGRYLK